MDKKRKVDSIEEEKEEEGDILPHSDLITPQEILSIFEADDYKRLQENIEKGLIKKMMIFRLTSSLTSQSLYLGYLHQLIVNLY